MAGLVFAMQNQQSSKPAKARLFEQLEKVVGMGKK